MSVNFPDWMPKTLYEWFSVVALVLSAFGIGWNIWHYLRNLQMSVRKIVSTKKNGDNYLLSCNVLFWNRSSQIKTVDSFELRYDYNLRRYWRTYQGSQRISKKDKDKVVLVDPSGAKVTELHREESFESPLDIQPHQSQSKWIHFFVECNTANCPEWVKSKLWRIYFYALSPDGKQIAKTHADVTLRDLVNL